MKPLRITRLAAGEWFWTCSWCHAHGTVDTQPAAMALSNAHYILAHWSLNVPMTAEIDLLERIHEPVATRG